MFYLSRNLKNQHYLIVFLSCIPVVLHLVTNLFAGYGIFRDEMYYIACSNRLDYGYVDQPPLSIAVLFLNNYLLGDSVFSIRLIPALLSGLTVYITCKMVINLGGKIFSIILASAAVIFSPFYLGMNSIYSMNSFDIFLWALAYYVVLLIIKKSRQHYWIILGLIMGMGLMNKISFFWFIAGFIIGLLLSGKRKEYITLKPYASLLIAFTIFLPYLFWNYQNDFAHLEFIQNAVNEKYSSIGIFDFITGQFLNMNPVSALIWIPGLYFFLSNKNEISFRIPAIIWITTAVILILNGHSKAEYLASAYTVLFAGGAVFIEKKTLVRMRWIRPVLLSITIISGIILLPFGLPVLPQETFIKYSQFTGIAPQNSEGNKLSELPQFYADMHGWEEMAQSVSEVYQSLPKEDRLNTVIFGRNYGEASAMEYFKNKYPIPRSISGHNSYWIWGYGNLDDPVIIVIGGNKENLMQIFEQVEEAKIHSALYAMPYENNIPIYIARDFKIPLQNVWNDVKHFE